MSLEDRLALIIGRLVIQQTQLETERDALQQEVDALKAPSERPPDKQEK